MRDCARKCMLEVADMKVLVTGGSGFIGSAVCRRFHEQQSNEIVNVDSLTYAAHPRSLATIEASARYKFEKVDIRDHEALREVFRPQNPMSIGRSLARKFSSTLMSSACSIY